MDSAMDTEAFQSPARDPADNAVETEPATEQIMASGRRMADNRIPRNQRPGEKRKIAGITFGL
jgi:hypothetical protein